jgi:hypothetical protein
MFASIAGVALALQLGGPAHPLNESIPSVQEILAQQILAQEIRYRRHGHPPPCGHGYDLDQRDGKCYPNGMVPPRFQSGRYYPLEYGGGRRPVPCGHGADRDIRDGLCYPDGHGATAVSGRPPGLSLSTKRLLRNAIARRISVRAEWLISRGSRCGV